MSLPGTTTLDVAKQWLRKRADRGENCPCCGQRVQFYRRKINSGMARALIAMYRAAGTDWVHKPTALKGLGAAARDESLLRYWGLMEEESAVRADGGRSGWWRVTPQGEAFLLDISRVPKYATIYDGRLLGMDATQMVNIRDALSDKFNYNELMAGG